MLGGFLFANRLLMTMERIEQQIHHIPGKSPTHIGCIAARCGVLLIGRHKSGKGLQTSDRSRLVQIAA